MSQDTVTQSAPAIETRALTKQYGESVAVDTLNLSIGSGTVYGFLGPNGAGKTTTMRMLTGLIEPTEGYGAVDGVEVSNREELIEHIGFLPEEPPLYAQLTGREQLEFALDLRAKPALLETALELCDRLALDALDQRVESYSTGMKQKLAFTQAVVHDPAVVFLDEPTSGLDPRAARTMREVILEYADSGTTMFLSTHILPVVEAVADEVGVLSDGRLVAAGTPGALIDRMEGETDPDLEDAFLAVTSDDPPGQR